MSSSGTFSPKKIIGLIAILIIPATIAWYGLQGAHNFAELPVIGPKSLDAKGDTIFHKVAPFKFTNFDGQTVTNKTFEGKIYIANFIFTRCPSICPKMSANMKVLQDRLMQSL